MLFDGIPLGPGLDVDDDQRARRACCCCCTSSSPRSRASPAGQLTGTIQNDVLKEYIARGTYIYPPQPVAAAGHRHLRLLPHASCPRWNTISISGYHMAEAGATPVQEIAFTLANAIEYVRAALAAGPGRRRLRAAAVVLLRGPHHAARGGREVPRRPADLGARSCARSSAPTNPKSQMLRFHTQTAGVQLTAQQPEVNLVRVSRAGARRGARRHPVAAHQLLRRGDRAAQREGGPAGAAHPAGASPTRPT